MIRQERRAGEKPTRPAGTASGVSSEEKEGSGGRYIGVPDDYAAPGPPRNFSGMGARAAEGWNSGSERRPGFMGAVMEQFAPGSAGGGQGPGALRAIYPQYKTGDEAMVRPYSREKIAELQQKMAMSGLLTDDFYPGVWSPSTEAAFQTLLAMSNQSGTSWEQTLQMIGDPNLGGTGGTLRWNPETGTFERTSAPGVDAAPMVPELVTRITDPKVLESIFRRASIDMLGIGWGPEQLQMATQAFNEIERSRQRDLYEAQLAAGQLGNLTEGGAAPEAREVVDIPSPEGFIDSYVREKNPEEFAENEALNMIDVFMQTAGSTAWGVGRQF